MNDRDVEPKSAKDLIARGRKRLEEGYADEAIADFEAATRIDPDNFQAAYGRGRARHTRGEFDAAIADFDEALRLRPDDSFILGSRGACRQAQGDYRGAIDDYDKALPQAAWIFNARGRSLYAEGAYKAAIADYTAAIALSPGQGDIHRNRGYALYAEGDYPGAIVDLDEAIRLDPKDVDALYHRAGAKFYAQDFDAAVADYDSLIRLEPANPRGREGRSGALAALGREETRAEDAAGDEAGKITGGGSMSKRDFPIHSLIQDHFGATAVEDLAVTERQFPHRVRADLQRAIDRILGRGISISYFSGVRKQHSNPFEGIGLTSLMIHDARDPAQAVPPLYEEVDIGEAEPVRSLKNGLWLLESDGVKLAAFLEQHTQISRTPVLKIQVAAPNDPDGFRASQDFLKRLEEAVLKAESYRGKILSLEKGEAYSGKGSGIRVHKLAGVERDQVILPAQTLELLERNVLRFVELRPRLAGFGLAIKKGLLFYGPPGTGKTHTIHYLAGALAGHTTLLITAEQVGLLDEYMALARLLQPSVVVIEDVDLIARDRTTMDSPCEEVLLNKLLNEMDGLRTDAEILFVLTTNRPEALEAALASRPGRVDQAIEFPLPDEEGRAKLVHLYARGVDVPGDVALAIVRRTEGVSASFIKELMRRSTQFHLERSDTGRIELEDVDAALDELLFRGGTLNRTLLGGKAGPAA